jgi:hypothetical protein
MSKARKLRIWERDRGICYLCTEKVQAGEKWDAEHVVPWALSFDDSDGNVKVAHTEGCHPEKTKVDVATIAKAKAQGGETGQWARRQRREKPLIQSRPDPWPKGKRAWPKRSFPSRGIGDA